MDKSENVFSGEESKIYLKALQMTLLGVHLSGCALPFCPFPVVPPAHRTLTACHDVSSFLLHTLRCPGLSHRESKSTELSGCGLKPLKCELKQKVALLRGQHVPSQV